MFREKSQRIAVPLNTLVLRRKKLIKGPFMGFPGGGDTLGDVKSMSRGLWERLLGRGTGAVV